MPRKSLDALREEIAAESRQLARLIGRRDELKREYDQVAQHVKKVTVARDRHIKSARLAGGTTEQLAADTGLTVGRIRQIAPGPKTTKTTPAAAAPPTTVVVAAAVPEELQLHCGRCGIEHAPEDCEHRGQPTATAQALTRILGRQASPEAAVAAIQEATAQVKQVRAVVQSVREQLHQEAGASGVVTVAPGQYARPARPARASRHLPDLPTFSIAARVDQALQACRGDMEEAQALLISGAVQDAMTLLKATRAGARYDYTAHPSIPDPLKRPDRKSADLIWEGRPRYVNRSTPTGTVVDRLDINGAYLAALRRVHLPIGRLQEDPPGTPFDRRRSGIYLVQPSEWQEPDMPNPLGDGREATGPVWVTDSTLRLMLRAGGSAAAAQGKRPPYREPAILQSFTSGNSESMLTVFGDQMAAARADAIERDDRVTLEYVKALYSRFVSTAGDSRANHELFRPEWVHSIRSQAYANLWYKAEKARDAGLTVHKMTGTDELHLAGPWREATWGGRPLFREGRGLSEVKCKTDLSYTVGGDER